MRSSGVRTRALSNHALDLVCVARAWLSTGPRHQRRFPDHPIYSGGLPFQGTKKHTQNHKTAIPDTAKDSKCLALAPWYNVSLQSGTDLFSPPHALSRDCSECFCLPALGNNDEPTIQAAAYTSRGVWRTWLGSENLNFHFIIGHAAERSVYKISKL